MAPTPLLWADIDLRNFTYNFTRIKKLIGPNVKLLAAVKANAYGHGLVAIAKHAEKIGVDYLGVARLSEGFVLREAGVTMPILVLGCTLPVNVGRAISANITLNIMDQESLEILNKEAKKQEVTAKIHIKIDSGMHRLGLLPEQAIQFITQIQNYSNIKLEGIFTHFASADEKDLSFTNTQLSVFTSVIERLKKQGIEPSLIHAANSAATLRGPKSHFTMVRPGSVLYGLRPTTEPMPFTPKPVLSVKTRIVQIRPLEKGEGDGYGQTFTAQNDKRIATIPIGYGDGFRRAPQNFSKVLVLGKRVPVIGLVSMDQSSIDISLLPKAKVGDEVVIIGSQGQERITAEDVAKKIGTSNYEVVTALAERVTRVYSE